MQFHPRRHGVGHDKGHGLVLTIQMAPQESRSEVKVMTGGYSSAHWDQTIYQELLSFQPATLDNPFSLHVDNRMNNRCHYVFAFLHSDSL